MARKPVPHLEQKTKAAGVDTSKSPSKRNGPRSHGDRFKVKTPIDKSEESTRD